MSSFAYISGKQLLDLIGRSEDHKIMTPMVEREKYTQPISENGNSKCLECIRLQKNYSEAHKTFMTVAARSATVRSNSPDWPKIGDLYREAGQLRQGALRAKETHRLTHQAPHAQAFWARLLRRGKSTNNE